LSELELLAFTKLPGFLWQCVPKHSAGLGVLGAGPDAPAHPECEVEADVEFLPPDSKRIFGLVWPGAAEDNLLSGVPGESLFHVRAIFQFIAL